MTCDTAMLAQTAQTLFTPGTVVEMRVLGTFRDGTVSGYFNDLPPFVQAAEAWSGNAPGVYCTLNPCLPALLARAANRLHTRVKTTTSDPDIVQRCWLPLDFDPVRPAGISSTDAEHAAALARAATCTDWLRGHGWPDPVTADSGNGGHVLYRIDLPNDEDSRVLIKTCLEALSLYFSDPAVSLDVSVSNAARIWKLYGTLACKGDHCPERPHRLSMLLDVPTPVVAVTRAQLEALAALLPAPPKASTPRRGTVHQAFDLRQWITAHAVPVASEGPWQQTGYRWVLNPCPWDSAHVNRSAFVAQFASGAIAAGCHHNGCQGNDWHALRDLYEPGWHTQRFSSNGTSKQAGAASTPPPASATTAGTYSGTGAEFFATPVNGKREVFMPKLLAEALMERQEYRFTDPVLWRYEGGVYVRDEGQIHSDCLTLLGPEWTSRRRNEALAYVQDAQRLTAWQEDQSRYLNLRNGLFDLTTGTLGPHTPTHFSVVQLPMDYVETATCPGILDWFGKVTHDDDAMIQVLRAYLKAIVQGATQIQRVLEVVGPGGSGKGTYLRLAMALIGVANTMATELKHLETSRFELASTRWKRLIVVTDADRYGGSISNLKALTGGDLLRMEEKNVQERREQTASGLVLIAANEEVQSSDYSSGLGRRRLTLYFTHVPPTPRDLLSLHGRTFHGEFVAELPGLLAWVLAMPDQDMYDVLSLNHQYHTPGLRASWAQALITTNPLAAWAHSHLVCEAGTITQVGVAEKIDITITHHDPVAPKSTSTRETLYKNEATWLYASYVAHVHQVGSKPLALKRFAVALLDFLAQQLRLPDIAHTQDRYGSRFHGVRLRTAQDDAQSKPLLLEDDQDIPF